MPSNFRTRIRSGKAEVNELRRLYLNRKAREEIRKSAEDPWYWLTRYAYTLDSHDLQNPIKLFPRKPYIHATVRVWNSELLTAWEKSRQIMATWTFVALYLWDSQFHDGRLNFIQSKKEEDSGQLLQRARFIYDHQPQWMKAGRPMTFTDRPPVMKFPKQHSEMRGIPQGPDQIRQYTASGILADEAAFQEKFEKAFIAAKPTIEGGGRITVVSTPNGRNFFWKLVSDGVD